MHNADLAAYGLVPYGVKGLGGGDFREQAGPIVKDASDQSEIERAQQLLDQGLEEIGKTKEDMQDDSPFSVWKAAKFRLRLSRICGKQTLVSRCL